MVDFQDLKSHRTTIVLVYMAYPHIVCFAAHFFCYWLLLACGRLHQTCFKLLLLFYDAIKFTDRVLYVYTSTTFISLSFSRLEWMGVSWMWICIYFHVCSIGCCWRNSRFLRSWLQTYAHECSIIGYRYIQNNKWKATFFFFSFKTRLFNDRKFL